MASALKNFLPLIIHKLLFRNMAPLPPRPSPVAKASNLRSIAASRVDKRSFSQPSQPSMPAGLLLSSSFECIAIKKLDPPRMLKMRKKMKARDVAFPILSAVKTIVHTRVVDQAFPPNCFTWFLEISSHDDHEFVLMFLLERKESPCIFNSLVRIMD